MKSSLRESILALSIAMLTLLLPGKAPASGRAIDAAQFQRDLAALASHPSRLVGSSGYLQSTIYVESQLSGLAGIEWKRHDFDVMVPVTESATLDAGAGRVEKIHPFWPAHIRMNATPRQGIRGRPVYIGEGRYEQIGPTSLLGQIAVIEASAQGKWTDAFYFGAKAALILGTAQTSWNDLNSHDLRIPVNFPRFYIPPGKLADELRAGLMPEVLLKASASWQRRQATNYYALVKPAGSGVQGWKASLPPAALMFAVPLDSSSLVPDLSPGVSQAVQTAAGLALLRNIAASPWDRPVLVCFTSADSMQYLGTRNMFLALAQPPVQWRDESGQLDRQISAAEHDLARARELVAQPQALSVVNDRDLIERCVKLVETDLSIEQDQLFRLRADLVQQTGQDHEALVKQLEERQLLLNRLRATFQQKPGELGGADLLDHARRYVSGVVNQLAGSGEKQGLIQQYRNRTKDLAQRMELYAWLANAVGRPPDPDPNRNDARLIELMIGLDLSDRGSRVGPMFWGMFQRNSSMPRLLSYRDWFTQWETRFANREGGVEWWAELRKTLNVETLNQTHSPSTFLSAPLAQASELAQAWGVPGLTMMSLDDMRLPRDTPADTLDRIDTAPILRHLQAVQDVFHRAAADAEFQAESEIKRLQGGFNGQVVSASPGKPVPDLPREGFLATYYYLVNKDKKIPFLGLLPWTLGVRRTEVRECDALGNYQFEGLPRLRGEKVQGQEKSQSDMQLFAVHVYRMDEKTGEITATTDVGKQVGEIKWWVDLKPNTPSPPLRNLVFNCEEFSLTGLYDPRFLQSLGEIIPLDARRNAEPQKYSMMLANQMLAGFAEPGMRSYLLIRYGRVGNRLVLINMPAAQEREASAEGARQREEGLGFTPDQLSGLGPLSLVTSRDFHRLDARRLESYRRAGVSSSLIDALHEDAGDHLKAAEHAMQQNDGVALVRNATGAWANEARVYDAAQNMARDVIRGAVFLLMLCVPFAFCMERLLIGTASVYKQIAGAVGIFAAMAGALWMFHPAFKISASPLIIILAFAIILMAVLVIVVVYGKFDTELKRLRSGRGAAHGASFANAGVLMSAVLLGIANMRRRKLRTALTSITIVLITFAVLCFTGASQFVGTVTFPTNVASSHPGVLLRQRGFRPMPEILADQLRAVLADPALNVGKPAVVERWWGVSIIEPKEQYRLIADGRDGSEEKVATVPAILGLSPGESGLSGIAEVIGPEKFARLESNQRNIVYLSDVIAERLEVKEGDSVRLGGMGLEVAGVFSADAFDQKVFTLSGEPLSPLKYSAGQLDAGGRKLDDDASESLDLDSSGSSAEASISYEHLSSQQIAIVPASFCKALHNSSLRSVAFRLEDEDQVKRVSDELSRRFALAMYAGYDEGVRLVAASNLTSVSGASQVAIPLAVAGLIIFNTMMGSIAERKREIHIYTSLGLAPLHVGALFVAEAMTYGLIGTVFGYVIGQGVGTIMLNLGWLGSATLNYSGTSAMLTMGLILLIVLLSALVPARLASKLAAPSIDRTWRVPEPKDDEILAVLPFTINRTAADGALAYLAEFFEAHRDGNIGKFSAGPVEVFPFDQTLTQSTSRGLKTTVWLTPFDLGIRQHLKLLIHPGEFPDVYEVQVVLQRLSGDDGSWVRLNKTFLTELRKQFLQWRSLTPARMMEYVEMSKDLFGRSVGADEGQLAIGNERRS